MRCTLQSSLQRPECHAWHANGSQRRSCELCKAGVLQSSSLVHGHLDNQIKAASADRANAWHAAIGGMGCELCLIWDNLSSSTAVQVSQRGPHAEPTNGYSQANMLSCHSKPVQPGHEREQEGNEEKANIYSCDGEKVKRPVRTFVGSERPGRTLLLKRFRFPRR
ncbi:uncharacterized protein BDZ99DRAFT_89075 [Mytilinidion resinicola]|uniref:Uncharacterized protein n=1 Tax=Mytilinidion resinicola TaxID=574789 RepID=A0A6A6YGE7_9PEZI|nr:uncharacterized protein BDZ99DRAFT_89075 [Mytilinidion resinicola]KAF2806967.1 hypothetical protein BDZ99DRAFT_89075 [Mytilinidion resinicola]